MSPSSLSLTPSIRRPEAGIPSGSERRVFLSGRNEPLSRFGVGYILKKHAATFPDVKMVTIADFGGWAKAQEKHFADGGLFDQIYAKK